MDGLTILVPDFVSVSDGRWSFEVTTWNKRHRDRPDKALDWEKNPRASDEALEYLGGPSYEIKRNLGDQRKRRCLLLCKSKP